VLAVGERFRALGSKAKAFVSAARARGPQRAVLLLAGVVALLVGLVGWFVVTRGDAEDVEASGAAEEADEPAPTTAPPTTVVTTTVPETTTTTLSEEEQAELDVIEAYEAAIEIQMDASSEPVDPEHPELEEHFVGGALNESQNLLERMVHNGWAIRFPDDSVLDIDVRSVSFDVVDGVEEANLDVCWVTDEEIYWIESGEAVPHMQGLRTIENEVVMRKVDGAWKAADAAPYTPEEGITGCALD
jgi:hypothetical protein